MHACSLLRRRLFLFSAKSIHSQSLLLHPSRGASVFYLSRRPLSLSYPLRQSFSTTPLPLAKEPRKASSFWAITFALAFICGGAWLQDKYSHSKKDSHRTLIAPDTQPQEEPWLAVIDTLKTMPTDLPPGTIGNLTQEQEVKLKEFWILLLKVFGVKVDGVDESEPPSGAASPSPSQQEKKKSKRSRLAIFGRGKNEEDDAASVKSAGGVASAFASLNIADEDDKYGHFKEFQQTMADMSPEEIRTTFWNMVKHDNPDSLVLRFLRARKWDIRKALVMLVSTMRWRLAEVKVDEDIMKNGEHLALRQSQSSDPAEKQAGDDFLAQLRMGKSFLHGVDKFGRPICVVRVRLHKAGEQDPESLDRFTVYTIETARLMLAPPVETACILFDMTDFSLANMDYQPVKFMIKCFEANYPESLGVVLIHKAPWIFSGIWNIIKGWLDPVVAAKIQFTKTAEDLEKFIPRDRLMKELGGGENWEYKYVECEPDENKIMEDTAKRDELLAQRQELAKETQDATIAWISSSYKNDKETAAAAETKRNDLIKRLRTQYWELDPYLRARSLYDRLNVVQGGGKVEFYPTETNTAGNAASSE